MKIITLCLLAVLLFGCAYTSITKSDGTKISHISFLVNTKNIEIRDSTLEMILGTQVVNLDALQAAIDAYLGKTK